MTGQWEEQLKQLADRANDWRFDGADDLKRRLDALLPVIQAAQQQHGLTGDAGDAATASLTASQDALTKLATAAADAGAAVQQANAARQFAQTAYRNLPDGELSAKDAATVSAAAQGSTIFMGPISLIAGPAAVGLANMWLGNRRESAAQDAVNKAAAAIEAAKKATATADDTGRGGITEQDPTTDGSTTDGGSTALPSHGIVDPGLTDHTAASGDGTWKGSSLAGLQPVTAPGSTGTSTIPTGPGVTSDGPIGSGTTQFPGIGGAGGSGAGGGLLGGVGGAGLAGGVGAAAALGAQRLLANGGLGALGGGGGIGGGAGAGAGRLGGTGGAGRLGGAATADSAGGGGLLGATKGTGARGAALAADGPEGAARGGVSGGGAMAGGGAGAAGGREKKGGRGLGGPIAPKLEEDADAVQRSEAAGPGGRA